MYICQTINKNLSKMRILFKKIIFPLISLGFIVFFSSCNKDDFSEVKDIKLSLDGVVEREVNTPFDFSVVGDNQSDLTQAATYKVNGAEFSSNTFISSVLGEFDIQAFYNGIASNIIRVKVVIPSSFTKKVLVEDYTGTWCGWCPRVAHAIELVKEQSENVVAVAVHISDDFEFNEAVALKNAFGIGGLPAGRINRINIWSQPQPEHLNEVLDRVSLNAPLGISMSTSLNGDQLQATLKVGFAQDYSEDLKIGIYLVEDHIVYHQYNYTDYYNGEYYISDFDHRDVLRAVFTDIYGEPIPVNQTMENNIYEKSIEEQIPSSVVDVDNLHLVAFVTDANTNEVINVQEVLVGEEVDFE
jgi:thiol-disulfide isomerase/thioredoxin